MTPRGTFLTLQFGLKMWGEENEKWSYYYTWMCFKHNVKSQGVLRFHRINYDYLILSQPYGVAGN